MTYLMIIFAAVFANNFILVQFLGICPFLGVSKKTETALGMGIAVTFVMAVASFFTFIVGKYILEPLNLQYINTIAFILIVAGFVQLVEMFIKKFSPSLHGALGVYLPLITTNCAVLGVAIMNLAPVAILGRQIELDLFGAVLNGMFSGVGFTVAIVLLAGVREKLTNSKIPKAFQGFPITLIAASIMSLAFFAFSGITFGGN